MQQIPIQEMPTRKRLPKGVPFVALVLVGCLPSVLKRLYYRSRGARIGAGVQLGMFSYIESPQLELGDEVRIAPFTFIRTRGLCRIGARSKVHAFTAIDTGEFTMGEDSAILEQVTVGGMLTPRSALRVGNRVKIFSYSFLNPTEAITIEDDVGVGGGNYLFTHGSWQSMLDGFPASFGPITLKRGVWLPWRVFIMPNVTIGEYATIGAGSMVTRDIPARSLAIGSPAKVVKQGEEYIRPLSEDARHESMKQWLHAFAEYLNYTGHKAEHQATPEGATLTVTQAGGAPATLRYTRHFSEDAAADIIVVLNGLDGATRASLSQQHRGWFDIANSECGRCKLDLWNELRDFLSRYGLRFAVMR